MRTYVCIVCPNGCEVTPTDNGGELSFVGAVCERGREYVRRELTSPMRTFSSLVRVDGGERPLVGVRLSAPVPKNRIFDVMKAIRGLSCVAPVAAGQVLIRDVLGLGGDVVTIDGVCAV